MLARALIVLLLVLNLGVALWWATRAHPVTRAPVEPLAGVARLQLLSEVPQSAMPVPIAPAASATAASAPVASPRCFSFGPYADAVALAGPRARLQAQGVRVREREASTGAARGWQVTLPPLADRAAAQAMAERIKAAGFEDYYVQPEGDNANSIALGRYGSEAAARRRQAAFQQAGFPAQAQPLGEARTQYWIDAIVPATLDAAVLRNAIGAAQSPQLDCATLR